MRPRPASYAVPRTPGAASSAASYAAYEAAYEAHCLLRWSRRRRRRRKRGSLTISLFDEADRPPLAANNERKDSIPLSDGWLLSLLLVLSQPFSVLLIVVSRGGGRERLIKGLKRQANSLPRGSRASQHSGLEAEPPSLPPPPKAPSGSSVQFKSLANKLAMCLAALSSLVAPAAPRNGLYPCSPGFC